MLPPRLERPAQSRPGRSAGSHAALAAAVRAELAAAYRPGPVERGQPQGYFGLGASTVMLAAQPGRLQLGPDLIANTRHGLERRMRMGASLGRRPIGATEE